MKNIIWISIIFFLSLSIQAQNNDSTRMNNQPKFTPQEKPTQVAKQKESFNRIYYGGSLGFSFGTVTSVRVDPLLGYRLTPKLSIGVKALYEYNSYKVYDIRQNFNNYGGSFFSRFRFVPQAYAHAEFSYVNYEFVGFNNAKYRQGVPFIFLGGGFSQPMGSNSSFYAQILFDVLNDVNSPYQEWTPFYSVGVSIGF